MSVFDRRSLHLRALPTVGRSLACWIRDWQTVRGLATTLEKEKLLRGKPVYLRYTTSACKVATGREATAPHEFWEKKIGLRISDRIIKDLQKVDAKLVPNEVYLPDALCAILC